MTIRVEPFAAFADFIGERELHFPYQEGMTCADLWNELQRKYPRLTGIPALFARCDEYLPPESKLSTGDTVQIFPPVSGG